MRKNFASLWYKILLISLVMGGVATSILLSAAPVQAATGINSQINFQGRLLNSQGATVPDGNYNLEFKIYQDGDGQSVGDTTGSPAGTLKWTEDHLNSASKGVTVQNGYFSVQLGAITAFGSNVDWNQDTLWLSVQIGDTTSCTITTNFHSNCGGDGEMTPMKRLSSTPYSLNSGLLGGLASTQFVQLAQGLQADSSNNTSIYLNKTGTGNILDLQSGGVDAFVLDNSGNLAFGSNANHTLSVTTAGAGVAGKSLTLSAGGAGTGGSALAGGSLVLQGGAGGGTNGNGGNVSLNAGVKNGTGTDGTISIGTTTASSIAIGKVNVTTTVSGTLAVGSAAGTGSLTNNGSTINTTLAIGDLSGGGNIGTAAATVDIYTAFTISQTTSGQTISVPSPTSTTVGRIIYVSNIGSTSFTLLGTTIKTGTSAALVWNGSAWSFAGAATDAILNQSAAAQTANFYIRSAANNKVAAIIEGANGQAVDLVDINTFNGTSSSTVTSFDSTGYLHFNKAAAASDSVVQARVSADTNDRFTIGADGKLSWGPGNAATDVTLSRTGTGQATLGGTLIVGNTASSTALQVKNGSGNQVVTVDTSANQAILGQSSQLNGSLVFKNSSNANAITLNSTSAAANYTLTLPTSAPAAGLCLETSQASAAQLVFVSCSNNNASIQKVAQWDANNTSTVSVSPSSIGDEMVFTTQIPTGGVTVTGISGGGVTSWTKAVVNNGNGTVNRVEMWVGTVLSTGSSTITVTYSSSPGANEITTTEFTAAGVNASTSWGIESSSSLLNSSASSTVTFPNLTAINGSELYVGYAQVQNPPATAGATSGFNYLITSTQHNVITYNTSTSANTAYQPTATQNSAGQSNTVGAVLTAFVSSTSINNTTSLQKANFYVQAATSGSVAGVLQAASSGSADILDVRDSSAANVLAVGSTGNLIVKPATSTTAFQVQNSGGNGVLTVDTSNNRLLLGSANNIAGELAFSNTSNSNIIRITAPSSIAASYQLLLPSNTPTAGLCLGTSPSNANQLIFASCATQVSAASITYVNQWSNSGTSVTTLADSPATAGNLLVLFSHGTNNVNITGISGGGVTNWTKVTSNVGGTAGNDEMWRGVVTGAGAGTITVTYSAAAGANEITAQEYTMGGTGGGTWAVDTSGATTGSSTAINYPSLTPTNSSELYAGYAWGANTMSAGSTSGFTYRATNSSKYTAENTSVTGGVAVQPTATQSVSGSYNSIAALIQAYAGTSVIVNGTAAQQANFNVQAALSGTIAGVLQAASSGTADIFQAKDGSGNNVLSINGASGTSGVTLGTSGSVAGSLTLANTNNSNTITLNAQTSVGQSYILTLPSAAPAAGQCLAAGAATPTQLVFSSCANQVTSVAITFVNNWKGTSATNTVTLADSPVNLGDLMTVFVSAQKADTVTSVSGGGVTVWSKVAATSSGSGNDTTSIEMWRGIVTATGSSTITANLSGPTGTHEIAAMEFTTGSATGSWVVDSSNTQVNSTGTAVTFPNITPQSTKDLYVGYGAGSSAVSAGSTSGYTYLAGSLTNRIGLYNPNISAASQPGATQATSGASITVGALIAAYSSSSVIANSTVTQQANLNVQAGLASSVAAVLQAGQSGTADIAQIMDVGGTVVDSFSNTGNLLIQPSTASANAMRVQTTTGTNVLSVDTSSKLVVVGAGSTGESSPSLLVVDSETGTSADPTVLNGAMYYNATSHSFRCGVDGTWQTCSGLLYSNTSNSSANNSCTNNCSAFSTAASIPANYCQPGRVIKVHAAGYFSSTGSPNLQFGVYYGTSSSSAASDAQIGSLPAAQTVTAANNNYFQLNYNIICFSTSSMQGEGTLALQTGASSSGMSLLPINSTTGTTVVSSTAKNLYLFPIWDTASASNTATITQFTVNAD